MNINEWIMQCFSKLEAPQEYLTAYRKFILQKIEKYPEEAGVDFLECHNQLSEPDNEPEAWTHAEFVENLGQDFIRYFRESLKEGHLENYASAYANLKLWDSCETRLSHEAYMAIGASKEPWTSENPAYIDVVHACLAKGKNENFAHRCAKYLPEHDFHFDDAFEAALNYDGDFAKAMSQERSMVFVKAYEHAWNSHGQRHDAAMNYAECFENLLLAGRDSKEAHQIAFEYAVKHLECYFDDGEGNDEFQYDKYEALARAESSLRFKCKAAEDQKLQELFLQICRLKYPCEYAKHWFDEIEILARAVLTGNLLFNDIQPSPLVEFLERSCTIEKSEMDPRFDLMSEDDFKKYNRKSEYEQELWHSEAQFREDCRGLDLDPTDPNDRETCQDILDETSGTQ